MTLGGYEDSEQSLLFRNWEMRRDYKIFEQFTVRSMTYDRAKLALMTFLRNFLKSYLPLAFITDMDISITRNYEQRTVGTVAMT